MIDTNRTKYSNTIERPVVVGTTVDNEGLVLKSVIVNGDESLRTSEGNATTEVIAGFAYNRAISPLTRVKIEDTLVVPASPGPYTVQLQYGNIVSGSVRVYNVTGSADFTLGSVATGSCTINLTTGLLTFAAGNAGNAIIVTYRRNLTAIEVQQYYGSIPVNVPNPALQGNIVAMCGNGEIWTDQFDSSVTYDGVSKLYAGAAGLVTSASSSKTEIPGSRIIHVPSATLPLLGFRYNLA